MLMSDAPLDGASKLVEAAGKGKLAFALFLVLVIAALGWNFFGRDTRWVRIAAFVVILVCIVFFIFVLALPSDENQAVNNTGTPSKSSPPSNPAKQNPETKVTGRLVPPQKGKEVKILVENEKVAAVPDEYGRFTITVHKRSTERARFYVWVNGEQVYDAYEPLSGPVTLVLVQ